MSLTSKNTVTVNEGDATVITVSNYKGHKAHPLVQQVNGLNDSGVVANSVFTMTLLLLHFKADSNSYCRKPCRWRLFLIHG